MVKFVSIARRFFFISSRQLSASNTQILPLHRAHWQVLSTTFPTCSTYSTWSKVILVSTCKNQWVVLSIFAPLKWKTLFRVLERFVLSTKWHLSGWHYNFRNKNVVTPHIKSICGAAGSIMVVVSWTHVSVFQLLVVGGFNPFDKYESTWIMGPGRWLKKKTKIIETTTFAAKLSWNQ